MRLRHFLYFFSRFACRVPAAPPSAPFASRAALTTLSGNQAEVLGNLISDPLDMKQFQTAQENFVEKAVRSSFFIPIICFAVVLIYGFFFRNTHLKKEEDAPAQA